MVNKNILLTILLVLIYYSLSAQNEHLNRDSVKVKPVTSDSILMITKTYNDSIFVSKKLVYKDTNSKGSLRNFLYGKDENWPRPAVAVRSSLIFPGAGQFYNRSYWKIPLVWAGVGACIYFAIDNNNQYRLYQKAFIEQPQNAGYRVFRDGYRRNRDFSIILGILAYTLTAVEAYTDAHLKHFDVSDELSLHIYPIRLTNSSDRYSLLSLGPGVALKFRLHSK